MSNLIRQDVIGNPNCDQENKLIPLSKKEISLCNNNLLLNDSLQPIPL